MPFKPGQSGNPGGRKKTLITEELEKLAKLKGEDQRTGAAHLASVMWERAIGGDMITAQYIVNRIDGKPVETVRHEEGEGIVNALDRVLSAVKSELAK